MHEFIKEANKCPHTSIHVEEAHLALERPVLWLREACPVVRIEVSACAESLLPPHSVAVLDEGVREEVFEWVFMLGELHTFSVRL